VNIDCQQGNPEADVVWDLRNGMPVESRSCAFIYSEHVLEHLAVAEGVKLLRECRRVLLPGGVIRIAMPSLAALVERYCSEKWREQEWLTLPEHQFIRTRAEMLNIALRWWGHQWVYDREELQRRLRDVGFSIIRDVEWGQSGIAELRNRERRRDSLLVCEAQQDGPNAER
jgi:predicted SAM-dependent methyltransferase